VQPSTIRVDVDDDDEGDFAPIAAAEPLPPPTNPDTAGGNPASSVSSSMSPRIEKKTTISADGLTRKVETTVHNPDGSRTVTVETTQYSTPGEAAAATAAAAAAAIAPNHPYHPQQPQPQQPAMEAIRGRWRNGLCDCFETCCSGRFWLGWWCTGILLGQLMQRLQLSAGAAPGGYYQNTCVILTVGTLIMFFFFALIAGLARGYGVICTWILLSLQCVLCVCACEAAVTREAASPLCLTFVLV